MGLLVPVVGPSGAGKDTLMAEARHRLGADERFVFVRRVITRPASAGGEDHEPASEEAFEAMAAGGGFAFHWQAHGLRYGIPRSIEADLAAGKLVLANLSRSVLAEAAERYNTRVLVITAPLELLANRLAARGRETAEDISQRLAREVELPPGIPMMTVMNDGTPSEGADRLVVRLREAVFFASCSQPQQSARV
ncbi:phosphonate metabolism protein/1,5-bisphosphokinase (PRPP-forming) PhnN [Acetobacteraceae bacterium H6797]|nr:phosphonate metabolism protein/1,5-bisphosphokinase (PRPP-forming) PhnN [Acetobacteraceae bacterium H6797]